MKTNSKYSLFFLLCFSCLKLMAQTSEIALWEVKAKKTSERLGSYSVVVLNEAAIQNIYSSHSGSVRVPFAAKDGSKMFADVYLKPMENVPIKTNNNNYVTDILLPRMYSGKVSGSNEKSIVTLTLAPGFLSMHVYFQNEKIAVTKNDVGMGNQFILQYASEILQQDNRTLCNMGDATNRSPVVIQRNELGQLSASDKCTYVFVDCSNGLYVHESSSVQSTVNRVYSIWNDLHTLYENEQMNVKISEINVWKDTDPFTTTSTTLAANRSFGNYYHDNYWGNMALLMDWSDLNGGIAGGFGWAKAVAPNVCGNYDPNRLNAYDIGSLAYINLQGSGTFTNFPVPALGWDVEASTHELGHLFGSYHTQSCNWADGPIDNCVAKEGSCSENGTTPTNGGTIMSYCHLTSVGVNFNNGFGTEPGDLIRAFISANTCVSNCVACTPIAVVGTIGTQGFYHYEASRVIANGTVPNANTLIKLDGASKVTLAPGFKAFEGSKVQVFIDGCGGIR